MASTKVATRFCGFSGILALGCLTFVAGCGTEGAVSPDEESTSDVVTGVELALTSMPTSTQCLRVTATPSTGAAIVKQLTLAAGASTANVQLGTFNPGNYTIAADAFNVPCSSIGTAAGDWVADATSLTVRAGVNTVVNLIFRKNNPVQVSANFVSTVKGVATGYYGAAMATDSGVLVFDGYSQLYQRQSFSAFDSSTVPGNAVVSVAKTLRGYCAVRIDGTVWCWGENTAGELGPGIPIGGMVYDPVQIPGLRDVKLLASGGQHSCAYSAGTSAGVSCWGLNGDGQLGNNSITSSATPVRVYSNYVRSLSLGRASTYIVSYSGTLMSWGANAYGQLGVGTLIGSRIPNTVGGLSKEVVAGDTHACAIAVDGTTSCWGSNSSGQLGDGTTTNRSTPTPIAGLSSKQLAAGQGFTCALTSAGQVSCWGSGGFGQVGDGTGRQQSTPTPVKLSGVTFTTIGAGPGANGVCAIASSLDVYCWGTGSPGVGDGTPNMAFVPTKISLP